MQTATLIAFLLGSAVGAAACYWVLTRTKSGGISIERQMRELQEEFTAYRENVNTHFNQTAEMVNNLTKNYLSVQKHLEDAADSFAEPPKSFKLEGTDKLTKKKAAFVSLEAKPAEITEETSEPDAEFDTSTTQPPRDYAPKSGNKDKGTLSEDFGLHDTKL